MVYLNRILNAGADRSCWKTQIFIPLTRNIKTCHINYRCVYSSPTCDQERELFHTANTVCSYRYVGDTCQGQFIWRELMHSYISFRNKTPALDGWHEPSGTTRVKDHVARLTDQHLTGTDEVTVITAVTQWLSSIHSIDNEVSTETCVSLQPALEEIATFLDEPPKYLTHILQRTQQ